LSAASPEPVRALDGGEAASSATSETERAGGSSSIDVAPSPYLIRLGGITDEGVAGKVNQDAFFKLDLGRGTVIIGVFDGHGRELGRKAGEAARDYLEGQFKMAETIRALRRDPAKIMREQFARAHEHIESVRGQRLAQRIDTSNRKLHTFPSGTAMRLAFHTE